MANILVVDNQKWVLDLCKEGLTVDEHHVLATDDMETVRNNVYSLKPDIVLLNLYLKYGVLVWDVLKDIKQQCPDLPVIIVTNYDTNLFTEHLAKADGYLIKNLLPNNESKQDLGSLLSQCLA